MSSTKSRTNQSSPLSLLYNLANLARLKGDSMLQANVLEAKNGLSGFVRMLETGQED